MSVAPAWPTRVSRNRAVVSRSRRLLVSAELRSTDVLTVPTTLASAAPVSVPAVPR
jgi:hypothetical protein